MSTPLIFISHSSHEHAEKQFVAQLRQALEEHASGAPTGFKVLVDFADLAAGEPWNLRLSEWMGECHGAIILLNERALQSWWVLKEATILTWRRALDQHFHLYPVRLQGIDAAQLQQQKFAPLLLEQIQLISSDDAVGIADEVKARMQGLLQPNCLLDSPLQTLTMALAHRLSKADPVLLEAIAAQLGVVEIRWTPATDRHARCAEAIARKMCRGEFGQLAGFVDLVDRLKLAGVNSEDGREVLNGLAPFWVDAQAAAQLPDIVTRQPRWAAALNGMHVHNYTAEMYMRRAYPLTSRWRLLSVVGGEADARAQELVRRIRQEVRIKENRQQASDEEIDAFLKRRRDPVVIVLPKPPPDTAVLQELQSHFPTVTFLLHTGAEMPEAGLLPQHVERLTPHVDLDVEDDSLAQYEDASDIIRG